MRRTIHSSHWGAFYAIVRDGRLEAVEPFEKDSDPSPILQAMPAMVTSPARVRHPMIRKGWLDDPAGRARERRGDDDFVQVTWEDALDLLADELGRIRSEHGNDALFTGSYGWASAGRLHHAKSQLLRFFNLFGGSTRQLNSYSFAAAQALLPHVVGTLAPLTGPLSSWDGIAANTRLMVCFGGIPIKNSQIEAGGTGAHTTAAWLMWCRAAGVEFVNVSPNRADCPEWLGATWIPIRPNSDTAMLLAMCFVLLEDSRHDTAFLSRCTVGFERFAEYLRGDADGIAKTPAWASRLTGVPADEIAALARRMSDARSMLSLAWALQRAEHGEQPYWAAISLAAMLGQIGLPGGGFGFGYGAEAGMGSLHTGVAAPHLPLGENPSDSWIPVARIADMLLNPGESYEFNGQKRRYPEARLVYWCGGNPFHHHQDLNRLVKAFRTPDTVVVHECWWTATARHADFVLPATTTLERNDIGASRRDHFLIAMKQAVEPVGEARCDRDIFADLARRFGFESALTEERSEAEWLRHIYDVAKQQTARMAVELPDFDVFWDQGYVEIAQPAQPFTLFAGFRAAPDESRLATPSGRIELFSEVVAGFDYEECPGHAAWLEPHEWLGGEIAETFPLHLISNQPRTRLHSQMDAAGPSQASKIQGCEPVLINPADAEARGIRPGDVVRVFNGRGELLAGANLSTDIMPGVVQLATGAWYDPVRPFGLDRHGNPNVLTRDVGTSRLGQAPVA
ncbi:MAG: molybdopterin guanine dinucleotide-containing S/N-oxide reductase, partial [Hyphomicrobiales bacterium]